MRPDMHRATDHRNRGLAVRWDEGQDRERTNVYKRHDVFRCVHESHTGFESVVSPGHVLKEGNCCPEGCIRFHWLDPLHLRLGGRAQSRWRLGAGDRVELWGRLAVDYGRLVIERPRSMDRHSRGDGEAWGYSKALVAARSAAVLQGQPEKCLSCDRGPWWTS